MISGQIFYSLRCDQCESLFLSALNLPVNTQNREALADWGRLNGWDVSPLGNAACPDCRGGAA